MNGHIRCAKCDKAMTGDVCPYCGHVFCYISLYWKGTHYKFRRYELDTSYLYYRTAERQLTNIRSEIDGRTFNPQDWTDTGIRGRRFGNKLDEWLESKEDELEGREIAPETLRMYRSYAKNYYRDYPLFKNQDVKDIKDEQLEQFKDDLRKKNISIKTRKNIIAILRVFFVYLKKKKAITTIPEFPVVSGNDSRVKVMLERDEQAEALKRIPAPYRDPIEFSMKTGLRPGELCALKVKDIYMDTRKALIQRTYSGHVLKEGTKESDSEELIPWIPLSNRAIEILQRHMKDKLPESFVFINPSTNKGFRPRVLSNAWRKYSGINVTLYESTRHSFCSQIVELKNVNSLEAKQLMRHADIKSTEQYYHANPKKLRDIVDQLDKVVPFTRSGTVPKDSAK